MLIMPDKMLEVIVCHFSDDFDKMLCFDMFYKCCCTVCDALAASALRRSIRLTRMIELIRSNEMSELNQMN